MAWTLTNPSSVAIDLGTVFSEEVNESSELNEFAMPLSPSSSTNVYDYMGVIRSITIQGKIDSTTGDLNDLQTAATALHGLQTGNQSVSTYASSIHGTIKVKVRNVKIRYSDEVPNYFIYSMDLVESDNV